MTDDAQLLRRYFEDGSEAAFTQLVEKRLGLVYHSALRRLGGDTHLAHDVAQTVFILAARNARSLSRHSNVVGWLYTTTYFTASHALRTERRRRAREQEAYRQMEIPSPLLPPPETEALRPFLDDAVMKLDRRDREAVMLRYFEGYSFAQISARIGLSEDAAQKRVERALERLRSLISRQGIASSGGALAALLSGQAGLAAPVGLSSSISSAVFLSVAGPGASLLGALQIMTLTKISASTAALLGIASLAGLFSAEFGAYQYSQVGRDRAALFLANAQYLTEQDRARGLVHDLQVQQKNVAELRGKVAHLRGTDRAELKAKAAADWAELAKTYPEVRGEASTFLKAAFERDYRPFFESAGLSSAQIRAIEDQTIAYRLSTTMVSSESVWWETRLPPEAQLRPLIGDQMFQDLQEYDRTLTARQFVGSAISTGTAAGIAVSSEQQNQLAQIIANNNASYQKGQRVDGAAEDWATAADQAQKILSPEQWKTAQNLFLAGEFKNEFNQLSAARAAQLAADGEEK